MPPVYRVVRVDVGTGSWRLEEYRLGEILGPVDLGVQLHRELETWRCSPLDPCNVIVVGLGVFAGSPLFGSNRGVVVFRSPLSGTIHVSTVGGVGQRMRGMGAHALVIEGRAEEPSVLVVEGGEDGVSRVSVESVDGLRGAMRRSVFDVARLVLRSYAGLVREKKPALLAVGPGSLNTLAGSIVSVHYDPSTLDVVTDVADYAGRGGPGTALLRAHNIAVILAGGDWNPATLNPRLTDRAAIEDAARSVLGKHYGEAVLEKTRKYRFDERIGTGGTFGVNYVHYRELVPMLNYTSVYLEKVARLRLIETILELFWAPFQEAAGRNPRAWRTCGEPCPANCKKIVRRQKVDYEPFNALGPLIGVVVFDDAARLVRLVDEAGVDAIEAGYWVAWILELVARGIVEPSEACLDERPCFDPILLAEKPRTCSRVNARLAERILRLIIYEGGGDCELLRVVAEKGLRRAAHWLAERRPGPPSPVDLAVYAGFGEEWYMTPNLYWTPGLLAPVYVTGKYWTNYSPTFMEPEEYAETSYHRILSEYTVDNSGLCRFHRGWFEKLAQTLYERLIGVKVDLGEHARRMYRAIAEYSRMAGAEPTPWESGRVRDIVATIAAEIGSPWGERMVKEPNAPLEWWERFKRRLDQLIGLE